MTAWVLGALVGAAGAGVGLGFVWLAVRLAERESFVSGSAERRLVEVAPAGPLRERLRAALEKSRMLLAGRLHEALRRSADRDQALTALEEVLVTSDVGMRATESLLARLGGRLPSGEPPRPDILRRQLREVIEEALEGAPPATRTSRPWVIMVTGVNGVGKTTTIAKLAHRFRSGGDRVLLVAADTFRAGAIEQLGVWSERLGVEIVRHQAGADPAAVAYDGARAGRARGVDVVLVDTAGRLHTRQNLMDELRKVSRVLGREVPGAPHEVVLILDGTTGQNAVAQARIFTESVGVTGIILTKLDGTARGGAALAIREELALPILWLGVGEGLEDLRPFSAAEYAAALVGDDA